MHICFMANYKTTFFYNELAKKLKIDSYKVFWITVNRSLYNYLCSEYPKEQVLLINKELIAQNNQSIAEFKVNELIFQDRSLKYQQDWASEYLNTIQKPIYDFIFNNKIHLILGSLPWAHELLTHRICSHFKNLNCIYLKMHTIRMPYERFAFFCDEFESNLYEIADSKTDKEYRLELKKPTYQILLENKKMDKSSKKDKKSALYSRYAKILPDDNDPTIVTNRFERFKKNKIKKLNKVTYRYIKKISLKDIEGENFCFMPLHKQPESSIDGNGRYYEDQYINAVHIWRVLPSDWILAIKEHKTAIGDRSYLFYKKLQSFKNIVFVDENENSHEILDKCRFVATVSGTAAFEAGILGKPALVFAPVFFDLLPSVKKIDLEQLRQAKTIFDLLPEERISNKELERFLAKNSFDGIISDPLSNPSILEEENLQNVVYAIKKVYKDHSKSFAAQ